MDHDLQYGRRSVTTNIDRYAAFQGSSMKLWLRPGTMEIHVEGKTWVTLAQLEVGDVTTYGKVAFIGTLAEVGAYLGKDAHAAS